MTDTADRTEPGTEPTSFADALVCFADGTRARFTRVDFLPDGRLKATLTRRLIDNTLKDDDGAGQHKITETAYFAAGSFVSVQGPPRGVLIADRPSRSVVVSLDILPKQARDAVTEWERYNGYILNPSVDKVKDSVLDRQFELWSRAEGQPIDTVTFRWVWPDGHDQPLQQLARVSDSGPATAAHSG